MPLPVEVTPVESALLAIPARGGQHSVQLFAVNGLLAAGALALAFGVPWRWAGDFFWFTGLLSSAHLCLSAAALRARYVSGTSGGVGRLWCGVALVDAVYGSWLMFQGGRSILVLSTLYGELGFGLALVLGGLLALVAGVFGLVTPIWYLWVVAAPRKALVLGGLVLLLLLTFGAIGGLMGAWGARFSGKPPDAREARRLQQNVSIHRASAPRTPPALGGDGFRLSPPGAPYFDCPKDVRARATALVTVLERDAAELPAGAQRLCVQAESSTSLERLLSTVMGSVGVTRARIDWLTQRASGLFAPGLLRPLQPLGVVPGSDGVCVVNRCLGPADLVGIGAFAAAVPVGFANSWRVGASVPVIVRALGEPAAAHEGFRIRTLSVTLDSDAEAELAQPTRLRAVRKAIAQAFKFLVRAQRPDGSFRYELDAFSGAQKPRNPSIPRHAGTLLAACEHLPLIEPAGSVGREQVEGVIASASARLARWARPLPLGTSSQAAWAFSRQSTPSVFHVGPAALGLAALLGCRSVNGSRYDELIGGVAEFLLQLQSSDGHFRPGYRVRHQAILEGPTPVFAGGQALLALALFTDIQPSPRIREALKNGMDYVANDYWPPFLRQLFFLKENWHCAAARAALVRFPHADYQQFCLDYARFKQRFVLSLGPPGMRGGVSFSPVFPAHNGTTAGTGEALAAAIEISRNRDRPIPSLESALERIVDYLVLAQWTPEGTAYWGRPESLGGFSAERFGSLGRIDHVQHALTALGQGARVLAGVYSGGQGLSSRQDVP